MSPEHPENHPDPPASGTRQTSDYRQGVESSARDRTQEEAPRPATVVVRGETVRDDMSRGPQQNAPPRAAPARNSEKPSDKKVSETKIKLQSRLPALDDDADVGVQKEQRVVRDGKADLAFTGTLLASAAPPAAPQGHWDEYRVYATNGGKHVFSKVTRSVYAEEQDRCEAEVFEPSPSSVPSQLMRSARELTRSRPVTWSDAAVSFFGYNPLAKALYRKLGDQFDEHIS
jgi:hypothetical protein